MNLQHGGFMKAWHGVLILIVGYFLGAYFGSYGKSAISKIQGSL
jgi:hypothetical protein